MKFLGYDRKVALLTQNLTGDAVRFEVNFRNQIAQVFGLDVVCFSVAAGDDLSCGIRGGKGEPKFFTQ